MPNNRILYVAQEISPYLSTGALSDFGKELPQSMQEHGSEVRIFMPKFGAVNERRNQLHEVIRLSGMNITIDDNDRPLIVKVASLQPSRIQVYFIDSDDFFLKSADDVDPMGSNRNDNDERGIFFARGTMETVKKLRWEPGIVQCAGWISAFAPAYMRRMLHDCMSEDIKIVYEVQPGKITGCVDKRLVEKLADDGINVDLAALGYADKEPDTDLLHRIAISHSDAVIVSDPDASAELLAFIEQSKLPVLPSCEAAKGADAYREFYATFVPASKN